MTEPWLLNLKAGVEAGLWKVESGDMELVPLPVFPTPTPIHTKKFGSLYLSPHELASGHLGHPNGRDSRFVPGLAAVGDELVRLNPRVCIGDMPEQYAAAIACAYYRHHPQEICLATRLYDADDATIRSQVALMAAFCALKTNDVRAGREWCFRRFGPSTNSWAA